MTDATVKPVERLMIHGPAVTLWDHPYEGDPYWPERCIHCGFVGSYAHTEEFYRRWALAAQQPIVDARARVTRTHDL